MVVIRHADSRRTETPNAVMTTLASPTLGGTEQVIWRVDMRPGQAGPPHAFDREQVWTVLDGGVTIEAGDETVELGPGDTAVLPAAMPRRVHADPALGLAAIVATTPGGSASTPDRADPVVPAWTV